MKVGVLQCESFKLLAVIKILLATRPKNKPDVTTLMTFLICQQPVQHRTEWSNSRPCRDKHGITHGWMQSEIAEWPLKVDLRAFVQIKKIVGHEPVFYPIETEGNVSILRGRRCNGVGARHLLAIWSVGLDGEPLSGNKTEVINSVHL